ncbi:MAG: class I SAM-dependent methyltransferase [Oscillospiraceae bacterium]|nr:class I SAM-dependent methyltransferase [Oscillospiraceae bacterium]
MSTYESMHPGGLRLTDRAARIAALSFGMKLLDIGCGTGVSLELLEHKFGIIPYGIDLSERFIQMAKRRLPEAVLIVGDATYLPYEDMSFDVAVCECMLSLLTNPTSAILEVCRILRTDGTLIVSDICGRDDADTVKRMCSEAGFDVTHFEEHRAALITYAVEMHDAGAALCGDVNNATYYLLIGEKR